MTDEKLTGYDVPGVCSSEIHSSPDLLEAYRDAIVELECQRMQLAKAIHWALGYTDFRPREEGEGAYWWRKELRERSGLTKRQLDTLSEIANRNDAP